MFKVKYVHKGFVESVSISYSFRGYLLTKMILNRERATGSKNHFLDTLEILTSGVGKGLQNMP